MPKFYDLLKERLEGFREGVQGEILGYCPFPHEKGSDAEGGSRSLAVNHERGVFNCFSCRKKGNDVALIAELFKISYKEAKLKLGYSAPKTKEVPIEEVRAAHEELLKRDKVLEILKERGIDREVVLEYQLGYLNHERRLWIPIRDEWGRVVNVRKHLVSPEARNSKKFQKTVAYAVGYNVPRLYPVEGLEEQEEVLLCEGELDAIVARVLGFPAITVTAGAGTWDYRFNKLLAGKRVYIAYDTDEAGRRGAEKVAKTLYPVAQEIKIIELDLEEGKDITDYFIKEGHSPDDLRMLMDQAEIFFVPEDPTVQDQEAQEVDLANASLAELYSKKIQMTAVVAGKDLAPYIYPKHLKVTCEPSDRKACAVCGLSQFNGNATLSISPFDDSILKFINCTDREQKTEIARRLDIVNCSSWQYTIEEAGNIEEIRLIPELDYESESSEYVMRRGFYVGHGIKSNASYKFTGIAGADPQTQHAVPILSEAHAIRGSLDNYEVTEEIVTMLEMFKVNFHASREDQE